MLDYCFLNQILNFSIKNYNFHYSTNMALQYVLLNLHTWKE